MVWCAVSTPTLHTGQSPSSSTTITKCCKASKKYIPCRKKPKKSEFHPRPFFFQQYTQKKTSTTFISGEKDDNNMAAVCNVKYADATHCCCCADADIAYQNKILFLLCLLRKNCLVFSARFFSQKLCTIFYTSALLSHTKNYYIAPKQKKIFNMFFLQKSDFL